MNPWKRLEALLQPAGESVGVVEAVGDGRVQVSSMGGASYWVDGVATVGQTVVVDAGRVVRVLDDLPFYELEV